MTGSKLGGARLCALLTAIAALAASGTAHAATPAQGTVKGTSSGGSNTVKWTGSVHLGSEAGGQDQGLGCFGSDNKPADPTLTGCDIFVLNIDVPSNFYKGFFGGASVSIGGFSGQNGVPDLDMYIYRRNADGTANLDSLAGSSASEADPEQTTLSKARGSYFVVVVPFATGPTQSYNGQAKLKLKRRLPIAAVNKRAPRGAINYRASRDKHLSHSEPTIAMDPLNHNHLIAGSKQYDNLAKYLFKIGTYESYDGGRTWRDYDQLPGYCGTASACDPSQPTKYRVVSDVSQVFDDEGNAYSFVLDSPGGTSSASGWNMNLHIKKPHQPWSKAIVVHSNSANPLTQALFLDDKNWLAIDNKHTADGGVNKPRDHKIGPMYTCWSLDQGGSTPAPGVGQEVVFMRSSDGGHTWGGVAPGDNTPLPLSQKGAISGLGCHIIVGPSGEVYVTWYDTQLDALMQVKSTDFGASFTPARPVVTITGENNAFPGQAFRNLSIPSTGVDAKGNVYLTVDSRNGEGAPVVGSAARAAQRLLEEGKLDKQELRELVEQSGESLDPEEEEGGGSAPVCPSQDTDANPCTDVILFKSTDGGTTYGNPVRVNQDDKRKATDQFQPWLAITPKGQVDISYFDRRNDPNNFYIDTYLSRSNDGGRHFKDTRASHSVWDPEINPPISPSGQFIGDYQGLVADDKVAIPFWNDTQYANLSKKSKRYSPYQEVSAARIPNTGRLGGPARCVVLRALHRFQVKPRGRRRLSIRFTRLVGHRRAIIRIYKQTRGRRIIKRRQVARFNRKRSFTWRGKPNIRGRHTGNGFFVVTARVRVGRRVERITVATLRRHGRFHKRHAFVRHASCSSLAAFGLGRPVFGGSNHKKLAVAFRLRRAGRVKLTLMRGKHVVRRLIRSRTRSAGLHRRHISPRHRRKGNYWVALRYTRGHTVIRARLSARRL